ncbi:MAG TPA: DNA polymerase III subunit delta [Gemmatimonadales bacterium]|nr:DNA polymerase III subunit delta [Gemmatimonadales bacterium]
MGVLSADALARSVRKAPPDPVYYLYGDEDLLKDEAVRAVCDAALAPEARDFNLDVRAAPELDAEALHTLLNTPPMLAERRVVVLREVQAMRKKSPAREALLAYLANPSPTTVLVLVQAGGDPPEADLARGATAVELARLPPDRVARWATRRAKEAGLELEPEATALLVATVGDDLGVLARELEKLAGLGAGGRVTREQVAALVGVRHGETVHDLVDAVLDREFARAARLVEPVLEQAGMTGVRIVTALGTALLGTALARAELEAGTPRGRLPDVVFRHLVGARPSGLRAWREEAARFARRAERWTAAELSRALRLALEADGALKRGGVSRDHGIVTQLVLGLAVPEREAA